MNDEIIDLSKKRYAVTVYEVRQRVVQGEEFIGQYSRTVMLSDGTQRTIKLQPVVRNEEPLLEINTGGATTFSGIIPLRSAAATHGTLMVHVVDLDDLDAAHEEWRRRRGMEPMNNASSPRA